MTANSDKKILINLNDDDEYQTDSATDEIVDNVNSEDAQMLSKSFDENKEVTSKAESSGYSKRNKGKTLKTNNVNEYEPIVSNKLSVITF